MLNLLHHLAPLYQLLKRGVHWHCKSKHSEAFQLAKNALQADSLLVHFDPTKQIVFVCDASPPGLSAMLSHIMPDGQERPISRLTVASREAKEEAASARPDWTQDSLHVSILHEAELGNLKMP